MINITPPASIRLSRLQFFLPKYTAKSDIEPMIAALISVVSSPTNVTKAIIPKREINTEFFRPKGELISEMILVKILMF